MSDKQEAPERIRKLMQHLQHRTTERGFTEAEAMTAAERLAELEDRYFIALSEIGQTEEVIEAIYRAGKTLGNVSRAAGAIARFCDCKYWYTRHRGKEPHSTINYMGLQSDTAMAMYLIEMFDTVMRVEWAGYAQDQQREKHWLTPTTTVHLRPSFEIGMMDRLSKRLHELKLARNTRRYDEKHTGQELVVVKSALVQAAYDAKFPEGLKSRQVGGRSKLHDEAVVAGQRVADTVNIERPIAGGSAKRVKGDNK